jgi:hypothetical protein
MKEPGDMKTEMKTGHRWDMTVKSVTATKVGQSKQFR